MKVTFAFLYVVLCFFALATRAQAENLEVDVRVILEGFQLSRGADLAFLGLARLEGTAPKAEIELPLDEANLSLVRAFIRNGTNSRDPERKSQARRMSTWLQSGEGKALVFNVDSDPFKEAANIYTSMRESIEPWGALYPMPVGFPSERRLVPLIDVADQEPWEVELAPSGEATILCPIVDGLYEPARRVRWPSTRQREAWFLPRPFYYLPFDDLVFGAERFGPERFYVIEYSYREHQLLIPVTVTKVFSKTVQVTLGVPRAASSENLGPLGLPQSLKDFPSEPPNVRVDRRALQEVEEADYDLVAERYAHRSHAVVAHVARDFARLNASLPGNDGSVEFPPDSCQGQLRARSEASEETPL